GARLVALSGCPGHVADRGVRPPRGQADLLGPAVPALPSSRGRPRTGVDGPRPPGRGAPSLRPAAGHRAGPGRHGHRPLAGPDPEPMTAALAPLTIEIGLAALLLVVFLATLVERGDDRRAAGWIATFGVLALLGLAMALPPSGSALGGMFVQDGLAVF